MPIRKEHYFLLAAICASLFTTPLMAAGINAVLPELGASLSAGAADLGLVGASYSLGLAVFQLACGSMGDIWGHKRVFMLGAAIFCAASLAAGCQVFVGPFLLLRFIQGLGGALLSAAGLALLASAAPPAERTVYLGFSGAAVYSGIACGPPIAGFISGALGWRWIFWLNAAASLMVLFLMWKTVRHDWRPAPGRKFDWPGCVLYGLAMISLTIGSALVSAEPATGALAFAGFFMFLALFGLRENKSSFPVLNLGILVNNRQLALSCIAAFINYASFLGIIFYFSFYLQTAHGLDVRMAGLVLAIQPGAQALGQPLATRLCKRWGDGPACAIGAALCGLGILASAFLAPETPLYCLFGAQILLGLGMSLFALANTAIILESAGRQNIGQASALTGAMRTAGQLASMALVTFTLTLHLGEAGVSLTTLPGFMLSMRQDLLIFGALNLCAISAVLTRNRRGKASGPK